MAKLWQLHYGYGENETRLEIPKAVADGINKAIASGQAHIVTPLKTFKVSEIRGLEETAKEDMAGKKALQAGLNAFKGDVNVQTDKDGYLSVQAIKVKKEVSQREYASYYSKHPSYETVGGDGSGHWVAFWIAKDLGVPDGCVLA